MKMLRNTLFAVATLVFTWAAFAQETPPAPAPMPAKVDNFRLVDQHDKAHELYRLKDAPAVVLYIYGLGCPIVQKSAPELERLKTEYAEKGVQFLLINPSDHDTRAEVVKNAQEFNITIPILGDPSQTITRSLGVTRTCEAIVVLPKDDWKIVYRGAIDDRFDYGAQKPAPTKTWLRDALNAVLAGQPVAEPTAPVKGCLVTYATLADLSYEKDIAPIVQSKCVSCHTEGGIGPFNIDSHKRLASRSDMIREVIRTKLMPPWHADAEYGKFAHNRALTVDEERKLLTWIEQGAKRDESAPDPLAQAPAPRTEEFTLGKPDLLLQLPSPQEIPAEGIIDYRYITVPTGLTEDKWVKAIEVTPTNLSVVHHALIFVLYPKEYRHLQPNPSAGLNGYFGAYLPGAQIEPYPEGSGQFLPAGSSFIFQMHYNTTGKAGTDQTKMALYFHDTPPARVFKVGAASETEFRIPPNTPDHPVEATERFEQPVNLYGLSPHMHYRGGRAKFMTVSPDQSVNTLMNVPFYQFDWQPMYFFDQPIPLAPDSLVRVEGGFDNTVHNPKNPNPNTWVFFGEQSFEEMFIGYIAYGQALNPEKYTKQPIDPTRYVGLGQTLDEKSLVGTKWRMRRGIELEFQADGVVVANGTIRGKWKMVDHDIFIESSFEDIWLSVMGDELVFQGRPMRRTQ